MLEKIYLYYTNDLHSNFDYWPQVVTYLNNVSEKRMMQKEPYFIMDIGDHIDRVHPIAEAFMGKANVKLLNDAGYHMITIGNNEGITLSHEDLFHLYDDANFQVICSNLSSLRESNPEWLLPKAIKHTSSGVKIGVLGLTAPFNAFYNLLDWHVNYPIPTLERHIEELKQSSDIIVLLSHLGLNEDRQIASTFKDIDVIIGGHTHHLLRSGEMVEETLITAAGKHCAYVGEVHLTWDHENKQLIQKDAFTTNITYLHKDERTENTLTTLRKKADDILSETIVHIDEPLDVNWFKKTEIMEKLTHTLKDWTKADCAMLNAGLLLEPFDAGQVTYKDVHKICPHPINPCVVELNGSELLEVIRVSLTKELTNFSLEGFGFRGRVIGKIIFAGIEIETAFNKMGEEYVKQVTYENDLLDTNKTYTLATADTFTFGRLFPEIAKSANKNYFLPEFIRDLLKCTLKKDFK